MQSVVIARQPERPPAAIPAPASSRRPVAAHWPANRPSRPTRPCVCLECGDAFEATQEAEFCCTGHRKDWNNRRMQRGAQLYDLWMSLRYERGRAKLFAAFTLVSALASAYRKADKALRGGRRSWRKLEAAVADIPNAYGLDGDRR